MTEITDLSTTDSANTAISTYSVDGNIANMSTTDNVFQAIMGLLARSLKSSIWRMRDGTDPTKLLAFDLSGLTTATTRTLTAPNASGTIALIGSESFPPGYLFGAALSNNVADATNDIDISAGSARDSTNAANIVLAAAITKRLDAAWAVGTNQGWLDTGAIGNNWYHVFLIRRPDTGVVDCIASLSSTAPTLPANYTQYRRIGAVGRFGGALLGFIQYGDDFVLKSSVLDSSSTNPGIAAVLRAVTAPGGSAPIKARGWGELVSTSTSANYVMRVSDPATTDNTPSVGGNASVSLSTLSTAGTYRNMGYFEEYVNSSSQVRTRLDVSDANTTTRLNTLGWTDTRGK